MSTDPVRPAVYVRPVAVRIHVLIDSLAVGGAETLLADYAAGAREAGLELSVGSCTATAPRRHGCESRASSPRRSRSESSRAPRSARGPRPRLRRSAPDLIHTHLDYADLLGGLAARSLGIPAVSTLHVAEWRGDLRQRVRLRVVAGARRRCADRVIAVSEAARQSYLAHGWDRPERVVAVHNGIVDIPSAKSGEAVRSELGIDRSELVIGMISVLRGGKGHDVAAAAVRRLLTRFGGLRLLVAGDGPRAFRDRGPDVRSRRPCDLHRPSARCRPDPRRARRAGPSVDSGRVSDGLARGDEVGRAGRRLERRRDRRGGNGR